MSNKDLLKLENEYRDELPKYKEKPKMTPIGKPTHLTNQLSSFLAKIEKGDEPETSNEQGTAQDKRDTKMVEMDIYITPTTEE